MKNNREWSKAQRIQWHTESIEEVKSQIRVAFDEGDYTLVNSLRQNLDILKVCLQGELSIEHLRLAA